MNTATTYLFPPAKLPIAAWAVAMMVLHPIASLAADGQQPVAPVLEKRVARVSLADLDTSTAQGAQAARDRLREAARRLCSQLRDSWDLGHQPHFVACVENALANAFRQLKVPAMAAVDGARNSEPTTTVTALPDATSLSGQ